MTVRTVLALALLTQVWVGSAQVYFSKQIDWMNNYESLGFLTTTRDYENFLASGGSFSLNPWLEQAFFARFDNLGNITGKSVTLPSGSHFGSARDAITLDSFHSLIVGSFYVFSNGIENAQVFLIKINTLTGDTIWTRQYGKPDRNEFGRSIIRTKDQGFISLGFSYSSNNQPPEKILLIKVDSIGGLVFRNEYSTNISHNQRGWAIVETTDGGFLLSCNDNFQGVCFGCSSTGFLADILLLKTDALGNQQWSKVFQALEWMQYTWSGYNFIPITDSTFALLGNKGYRANGNQSGYFNYFLFILNSDGNIIDSTSYKGGVDAVPTSLIKLRDGNLLITGSENDSLMGSIGQTGVLMKLNQSLQLQWKKEYHISPPGTPIYDRFFEAIQMPDFGFVVCGSSYEDSTKQNGWILRVDSLGCLEPGCDGSSAAPEPPSESPVIALSPNPTGGAFRIALTRPGEVLLGVRLLDLQGRLISDLQYLRSAGWRECELDLSGQPSGAYLVQVRTSAGWALRKVLKQ